MKVWPKQIHNGEVGFYVNPPVSFSPCIPIFVQVNKLTQVYEKGGHRVVCLSDSRPYSVRETVEDIEALMRGALKGREPIDECDPEEEMSASEAVGIVRQILNENGVPVSSFIDDHVKNAIVQRNKLARALSRISNLLPGMDDFEARTMKAIAKAGLRDAGIKDD